jgi:hypothetical protein
LEAYKRVNRNISDVVFPALKKHCSIPACSSRLGWNVCAGAIHRAYLHAEDVRRKRQNVGADVIKKAVCISADPKDHVDLARRYIDMGFDHLIFHSAGPDQRAFLEGYGRDVLPGYVKRRDLNLPRPQSQNPRRPTTILLTSTTPRRLPPKPEDSLTFYASN